MPSIKISLQEFNLVANAARDTYRTGEKEDAYLLEKLAQKMKAAIGNAESAKRSCAHGMPHVRMSYLDMPSVLFPDQSNAESSGPHESAPANHPARR